MDYYKKLKEIDFYKIHPSYLPFIGELYDEYKILQISESHYADELDTNTYGIRYFEKWYSEECSEVEIGVLNNNITRRVGSDIIQGKSHFQNFDNPLRSFRTIVLDKCDSINNQTRYDYNYFAFMNFYQIPAFEPKGYFTRVLYEQGEREGLVDEATKLLEMSQQYSTILIDEVIDILKPRLVVFTSFDAGDAYKRYKGKYSENENVIYVSHPNNPFPWSKGYDRFNGKRPKDVYEDALRRVYKGC